MCAFGLVILAVADERWFGEWQQHDYDKNAHADILSAQGVPWHLRQVSRISYGLIARPNQPQTP